MEEEIEREQKRAENQGKSRNFIKPGDEWIVNIEEESFYSIKITPERDA
jgi:hypothetical protein